MKEIVVTESFYELDNEFRKCQNYDKGEGTYDKCTTGYFMDQLWMTCGCLPYSISNTTNNSKEKVCCNPRSV